MLFARTNLIETESLVCDLMGGEKELPQCGRLKDAANSTRSS